MKVNILESGRYGTKQGNTWIIYKQGFFGRIVVFIERYLDMKPWADNINVEIQK